ncbi:C-terminal processing protease CtpA/Prc, contains a PDZ domain [Sphingomonas gellani]|uniref:C-terminal processing protease CtpA/Prc, contains a PDZ domain n=1 Tax=Sphingomonas gellani TaxID=1166340 RepID=A0A1H8H6Y4_9SPHN|nr:S41 family peptidase [Sphingomonas gellani]SEN51760.1 C-terminal processing protease CtpA/Prc, contains a PDZ domain [Sphingomonas gellani]
MRTGRAGTMLALAAMLAGCGGGGSSSGGGGTTASPTPTPTVTPTPTAAGCTLRERQNWAFAQLKEWYLFPDTLPTSLDPSPYTSVDSYVDALTATARSQSKDRFFTYLTSIKEENAYYDSGSSAGFGVRLGLDPSHRLFVTEAFENGPALAAGIDRGTEILAIGTSTNSLRSVSDIYAAGGTDALNTALGPNTAGAATAFQVRSAAGATSTVTVTKQDFALTPVSSRYGAQIINDGGHKVGYVNLRTFISTADPALRTAFATFRDAGVTEVVVDLRYNGGGLVSIAELMSNLLGGGRSSADVQSYTTFRPEKAAENETTRFAPQPQSMATTRVAFIGSGGTASASEYVINAFTPYLHNASALVGSNTYGKPVGQIALDRSQCDDRLRVIAFALENAAHQGAYYTGLANYVEASCQANDDIRYPLGDPREASTRAALDFVEGKSCTRITASSGTQPQRARAMLDARQLLTPDRPTTAQREVPGLF